MFDPRVKSLKVGGRLRLSLRECHACPLYSKGFDVHTYKGYPNARLFFVGMSLGREEQRMNECFVGVAGRELHRWIDSVPIPIEECFFHNVVCCHTPNNREPTVEEIHACYENLEILLNLVKPKVIIPLGNSACQRILGVRGISKKSGKMFESDKYRCKIMPLFHPSYVMQHAPDEKDGCIASLRYVWDLIEGRIGNEKVEYVVVDTEEKFDKALRCLQDSDRFFFDLETTGLRVWHKILGVGFSDSVGRAFYIPLLRGMLGRNSEMFDVKEEALEDLYQSLGVDNYIKLLKKCLNKVRLVPFWGDMQDYVIDSLKGLLLSRKMKAAQNAKYDNAMFYSNFGVYPVDVGMDPMLLHHLTDPGKSHALKDLVYGYPTMIGYDNEVNKIVGSLQRRYEAVPIHVLGKYCCGDCDLGIRLVGDELKRLTERQKWLYRNLYVAMLEAYGKTEAVGFRFDFDFACKMKDRYMPEVNRLGGLFRDEFRVNPASYAEISDFLFKKNGLKVGKKTKGGYSTDESSLKEILSNDVSDEVRLFCHNLLGYRGFSKVVEKIEGVEKLVSPEGRIHPSFNLDVARTGRLSSSEPNMQNFFKRSLKIYVGDEIKVYDVTEVRGIIAVDEGTSWLGIDYKTLEVMVLAWFSKDERLIEACVEDIHQHAAALMLGIPVDQVTSDQRRKAKDFVFGGFYGGGARTLMKSINQDIDDSRKWLSVSDVRSKLDRLLGGFPASQEWIRKVIWRARKDGYVENPFGRIRKLPRIKSMNEYERAEAERMAVNTLIQGTASDLVQFGYTTIFREMKKIGFRNIGWPFFSIHDENIIASLNDRIDDCYELSVGLMRDNLGTRELGLDFLDVDCVIYRERWGFPEEYN